MVKVLTLADLAVLLQVSVEDAELMRRRYSWPHVDLGWQNIRFTPAQVDEILAMHSVRPD